MEKAVQHYELPLLALNHGIEFVCERIVGSFEHSIYFLEDNTLVTS